MQIQTELARKQFRASSIFGGKIRSAENAKEEKVGSTFLD